MKTFLVKPWAGFTGVPMKTYRFQAAVSACLLLSGLACVSGATGGYEAPRMPDGAPDLRGIWEVAGTVNRNLEGYPAKGDVPAAKSVIIDPKSGKIPYRPEAEAKRNELANASPTADPQAKCDMAGVPRVTYIPSPFQIFQSANTVAIVYQDVHAFRWIPTGGRPHLDGADFWMGDSRGHWDGNTLVVDVTDLNDQTWLDETGTFHTDNLHVIERYTRSNTKQPWKTQPSLRSLGRYRLCCIAKRSQALGLLKTSVMRTNRASGTTRQLPGKETSPQWFSSHTVLTVAASGNLFDSCATVTEPPMKSKKISAPWRLLAYC